MRMKIWILNLFVAVAFLNLHSCGESGPDLKLPGAGDPDIRSIITGVASREGIVGMGAGIIDTSAETAIAVCGYRRAGSGQPAGLADLWHIGSCAKSMTATLAAGLVEEGKLSWGSALAEIFPEMRKELGPVKGGINLEQLLSHRSGLPYNPEPDLIGMLFRSNREQREGALRKVPDVQLESQPGAEYHYSNYGYTLAGVMIERVEGGSFEDIIRAELFGPLGMESPQFELEIDFGKEGVLWGHDNDGRPVQRWKRPVNDRPAIYPAGGIRCSLQDWAVFIRQHLEGGRRGTDYLSRETFRELHRSRGDGYALGWSIREREWGGGKVLQHSGSNGWNYSVVWVAPERGLAVFVCANQGGCYEELDEVAGRLIEMINER